MYRGRIEQEQGVSITPDRALAALGFSPSRPASLEGIQLLHTNLAPDAPNHIREYHYIGAQSLIKDALGTYAARTSVPYQTKLELLPAKVELGGVVASASVLSFPPHRLADMGFNYLHRALDFNRNAPELLREAEVNFGLAFGKSIPDVQDAKYDHLKAYHLGLLERSRKGPLSDVSRQSMVYAEAVLRSLGLGDIETIETIPLIEDLAAYAKEHGRAIGLTGAAAIVSVSLFATPTLANASTIPTPTVSSSQSVATSSSAEAGLSIGAPNNTPDTDGTTDTISAGSQSQIATTPTLSLGVGTPIEQSITEVSPSVVPIATAPTVAVSNAQPTVSAPVASMAAPESTVSTTVSSAPSGTPTPAVSTAPVSVATPSAPESAAPDTQTVIAPATPEAAPAPTHAPEQITFTPNQQAITSLISQGGSASIASASFLLRQYYGTPGSSTVTNADFLSDLDSLEASYLNNVSDPTFHEDSTYENTVAMALAVLDAAANDQTVLSNPEVVQLMANVTRPTDPDKANLFDTYLAQAKTTMTANSSDYLNGFNLQYQTQLETALGYALMGNVSDADQLTQIQQNKAAEAAAAAAAAEQQTVSGSVEGQAIQKMIDGQPTDTVQKRMYLAMQYFMNQGLTAPQAAGIVGNLMTESQSSMDPSKVQDGGGEGRGLAQWGGPRLVNLKAFAAVKGTTWDDFNTQLEFIWYELTNNKAGMLAPLKATTTLYDATNLFMTDYEVPWIVLHGTQAQKDALATIRTNEAQPMLNTFNSTVSSITQQQAAAAAASQAAAQKQLSAVQNLTTFVGKYVSDARNTYDPGNCTYWVDIVRAQAGDPIPERMGDAGNWATDATKDGYIVDHLPAVGAVFVIPYSKRHPYGHVGYVISVDAVNKTFTFSEMNVDGLSIVDHRTFSEAGDAGYFFIHDKPAPAPAPTPTPAPLVKINVGPSINLSADLPLNINLKVNL